VVTRLDDVADRARARGVRPWIAVKEALAGRLAETVAACAPPGAAVLQGGAALHFAHGSPRLSADIDYAGAAAGDALAGCGAALADAATELFGVPARWSVTRNGRLFRGKVSLEIDAARRLVLPVEAYDVPARLPPARGRFGTVETPTEIAADKIVATADRLARRGALKTTDLYDLWFVTAHLAAVPPSRDLVASKAADYAQAATGADLGAAARAVSLEELRAALAGLVPVAELGALDVRAVVDIAARLLEDYRDVL